MRVAIGVALFALAAGCATPDDVAGPSDTLSSTGTTVVAATTTSSTSTTSTTTTTAPVETTTTTAPHREIVIAGTGRVYTLEESQAFGEFGPLLWNLVTTIHHKDAIEHHPLHEWVIWGPLWGGRIYDPTRSQDVYGVTDLDAIDPQEVAGAIPMGKTIILRQVRWSLDDLNTFGDELTALFIASEGEPLVCSMSRHEGVGLSLEVAESQLESVRAAIEATSVPVEAVIFDVVDECVFAVEL
jgi:hypothetical protein